MTRGAGQGTEAQRARILRALVEVVAERGFAGASVDLVVARAKVSRGTFYEQLDGLRDGLLAVLDLGLERTIELVAGAFEREDCWQDGVRAALAALLVFLDSEPLLARVWLVESLAAGSWALEHRERNVARLREMVVSSWPASESWSPPPLAAEGAMASVLGVVQAHIVTGKPEPLIELLGPLMGLVAGPYLGVRAAEREIERGAELARTIWAEDPSWMPPRPAGLDIGRQCAPPLPAMLGNPSARRARQCLLFLAEHPDASNREIATGIGVVHQSQIARLLSYLSGESLVAKRSAGAGKRNAWRLTPHGREVLGALSAQGA